MYKSIAIVTPYTVIVEVKPVVVMLLRVIVKPRTVLSGFDGGP